MKKSFILPALFAVAVAAQPAGATHLSPEQALGRLTSDRQHARALRGDATGMKLTATVGNLYVFSEGTGFVVLPNEDSAPALLGYSEDGTFDIASNTNLAYWLESLSAEVEYMAMNGQAATSASRAERASIAPMITTRWNQGSPYNDDCPAVNNVRCVTGCVATATAQVLKYHNYPAMGTGTETYTCKNSQMDRELSFDYGSTTFHWDLMADRYDDASPAESKAAVAQLMYACGVGVHMNYTTGESGAISLDIPSFLIEHMGYDKAGWLAQRDAYGLDEWEDLIYNELKENRPVLYGGQGSAGGHEFVCDGYSSDGFFHFNWGWGGLSDGYFLLTALNPASLGTGGGAGGFNFEQDAVIGAQPAKEGSQPTYVIYNYNGDFKTTTQNAGLGSSVEFTGAFINYNYNSIPEFYLGIKLMNKASGQAYYAQTGRYATLDPLYYISHFKVIVPANLPAGQYTVTPAFHVDGGAWQDVRTFINFTGYLDAVVDDGTITFTEPAKATVTVTDITTMSEVYVGRVTPLSYTISNPGDTEFLGHVTPCLLNAAGDLVAMGDEIPVDILGGESKAYEDIITTFQAVKNASYTAGIYSLVFRDDRLTDVSTPVQVQVKADPGAATISVTGFDLVTASPVTDKKSVKFNVGVKCTAGYYTGALRVVIFPYRSGSVTSVHTGDTPYFYLMAGESATKTADLDLSALEYGEYFAMLYSGNSSASNKQIRFVLQQSQTGIDEVEADTEATETIYDLHGVRHTRPLTPGFYIINGKKTAVK